MLVPDIDGILLRSEDKEELWFRYYTAAPKRLRQFVERYNIVKRA